MSDDDMDSSSGADTDHEEEENFDEKKHASLLRNITTMDAKVTVASQRREAASMSEHHAPTSSDHVKLHELVGALKQKVGQRELKKQINRVKSKERALAVPLTKPEQERVHRSLAYEKVSKEVSKWNPIVQKNRQAEQLMFPLEQPDLRVLESANDLIKKTKPRTSLELEVAALLGASEHVMDIESELTPSEERALQAMSLEEAQHRRAELQKYRALLSYKEAKARRQKKIKSKKYHRILQKEKLKKEKKSLEELERTDPEAFAEKLQKLDSDRMQERVSLKHRGGSKFAKKQALYSKYSDQSREAVQDMLQKSRELSKKVVVEEGSSEEETVPDDITDGTPSIGDTHTSSTNPWMSSAIKLPRKPRVEKSQSGAVQDTVRVTGDGEGVTEITSLEQAAKDSMDVNIDSLFDQLEAGKLPTVRQMKRGQKRGQKVIPESSDSDSESEGRAEVGELVKGSSEKSSSISMSLKRRKTMEDFEAEDFEEEASDDGEDERIQPTVEKTQPAVKKIQKNQSKSKDKPEKPSKDKEKSAALSVNPNQYITIGGSDKVLLAEEEDSEEEEEQSVTIAQAFAADDVVDEFTSEKQEVADRDKPKDVDLTLPGWGSWGGHDVQASKHKKKRFTLKAPPTAPRKDRDMTNVIISEAKDNTIAKHQVNELPFPYTSASQFESSVRQPIGKTWNPETAYKQLIKPKKVTRLGTVIEPMSKNQVFKKQKETGPEPKKKKVPTATLR